MANPLVGKFFIGVHDGALRSGIIEAVIDDHRYLLRFDNLAGMTTNEWPAAMGVSAIEEMLGSLSEEDPPAWNFFETAEQRSKYTIWLNQEPEGSAPRIVRFSPKDVN